jgi:ABC-type phosphate transport system substrate-binding protein
MRVRCAAVVLAAALAATPARAGELIAHPTVNLTTDEIRDVFLGEKQFAGNIKLVPVNNAALQPQFLATVLQTDERKYAARWLRKSFREGLAPPILKGNDAEVAAFVSSTPGAVGYVSKAVAGVKVLEHF